MSLIYEILQRNLFAVKKEKFEYQNVVMTSFKDDPNLAGGHKEMLVDDADVLVLPIITVAHLLIVLPVSC